MLTLSFVEVDPERTSGRELPREQALRCGLYGAMVGCLFLIAQHIHDLDHSVACDGGLNRSF